MEILPEQISKTEEIRTIIPIAVDQRNQSLVAKDNSELVRIIRIMMKGLALPKTLDTEEKVIAAWQIASSLNLPPAVAMQNIAIIHGSACVWGQLPKALAERTGELEEFNLIAINEKQEIISLENKNLHEPVWGSVLRIKRKGRSINEYSFTMLDAEKASLKGKAGPWTQYTKIMLARRVIGQAIKFEFPDALMGIPVAEYDYNEAPDLKDVTNSSEARNKSLLIAEKIKASANTAPQDKDDVPDFEKEIKFP